MSFAMTVLSPAPSGPCTSHKQICASSEPDNRWPSRNGDHDKPYPSVLWPFNRKSGEQTPPTGGLLGCLL